MNEQTALIIPGVDTTGLTEVEVKELQAILGESFVESRSGIDFRPQRYKVNKDAQVFVDPFGKSLDELKGIVLFKQKVRGCWEEGNTIPLCSSFDGIEGVDTEGNRRKCASCPRNAWGSGKEGKGKECKEMRRIFLMTDDNALPIQVSFPPTSISEIDNFFSARITNKIPDILKEVRFSLTKQVKNGYTFAVAVLKNGDDVPPKKIFEIKRIQNEYVNSWKNIAVDDDEYLQDNDVQGQGGGDSEPY